MLVAWIAIALAAAAWLLRPARGAQTKRFYRLIPAAGIAALALWLGTGVRGSSLGEVEAFLPPDAYILEAANAGPIKLEWILNDHDAALATAAAEKKLVFVDFTGYTCTNCRWMEANMFTKPEVRASLSRFVLSRLFTDGEGEIFERQQKFQEEQFGTVALPLYAIVDGQGRTVRTFSGLTRNSLEFLAFLRDAS
jgi:thiol:disulfide interchange protein DsbD